MIADNADFLPNFLRELGSGRDDLMVHCPDADVPQPVPPDFASTLNVRAVEDNDYPLPWVDGAAYVVLTESDVAMMRHATGAGAVEMDFSEFYEEEDAD